MTANRLDPSWTGETNLDRAELGAVVGAATGGLSGAMVGMGVAVGTVPAVLATAGVGVNLLAYTVGAAVIGGVAGALTGWGYGGDGDGGHDTV